MTNLTDGTSHPSGEIPQSPEHVEGLADHADEFMDDLFGEVEYSLKLEAKQSKPRALSPRNHSQAGRALVPSVSDQGQNSNLRFTRVDPSQIELPPISSQDVLWLAPYVHRDPSQNGAIPQEVIHRTSFIDRILLIAACSSVLAAGILWSLQYRQFESRLAGILRDRPEANGDAPNTVVQQRQFTEDIRRLLAAPREVSPVATAPVPTLSTVTTPVPGSNLQYLPLYQPPQVPPLSLPSVQEAVVAAPPVVALPNPAATPVTVTAPPPVVAAAPDPVPQHTLVGILDLGDRSAAMFEVAGAVQSIALGKPIGSSGWLIAKIKQQEVTLKRGAETKVVLVGQKF